MSVARADLPAQEVANVTNWSAEAYCSSKDTVSRMNSPRNSKSSSTPHVSPEAKSHICIGVEVDMEEDCDTSSQSGTATILPFTTLHHTVHYALICCSPKVFTGSVPISENPCLKYKITMKNSALWCPNPLPIAGDPYGEGRYLWRRVN